MRRKDRKFDLDSLDSLFPDDERRGSNGRIRFRDLPYLSRPIVEDLHELKPNVVIAGDRGGRLFAFSVFQSWKRRFPGQPFPTFDKKIHFARVSSRSADGDKVRGVVHYTLEKAGLAPDWKKSGAKTDGATPKVVYMDDWAVWGGTVDRFVDASERYGLPRSAITFATMCGARVNGGGLRHVIGDPERAPRSSDWNDESGYSGVQFPFSDNVTPEAVHTGAALRVRQDILSYLDEYYSQFTLAQRAGQIAVGESVLA